MANQPRRTLRLGWRKGLLGGVAMLVLWISGCRTTDPAPVELPVTENQAYVLASYPHAAEQVLDAYRTALGSLGLRLMPDSTTATRLYAVAEDTAFPATIRVDVRTTPVHQTLALVLSRYRMRDHTYVNYPLRLTQQVINAVDSMALADTALADSSATEPRLLPQYSYPNAQGCRDVPYYDPAVHTVTPPRLQGSVHALSRRAAYTVEARQTGTEGQVYVRFVVDAEGQVPCADVLSGLGGGLNMQAIEAIRASVFEAGTYQGVPASVILELPVMFQVR